MGALRATLDAAGMRGPAATAAHFALVWCGDAALYRTLGVADALWNWSADELATDLLHKGVYAAVTGVVYSPSLQPPAPSGSDGESRSSRMTVAASIETGARPGSAPLDPLDALESALAGHRVWVVDSSGARRLLPAARWLAAADDSDHRLMLDHCFGPTLDLGCGPGRMLVALAERSVAALGVDASRLAVELARSRGVRAIRGDVLRVVPGKARWRHVLLADGNIGIGGDPVRLLRRVAAGMDARGSVLVEIGPPGTGLQHQRLRLDVAGRVSAPFRWARLGVDAIEPVAKEAGLRLRVVRHNNERHVAELTLPTQRSRP